MQEDGRYRKQFGKGRSEERQIIAGKSGSECHRAEGVARVAKSEDKRLLVLRATGPGSACVKAPMVYMSVGAWQPLRLGSWLCHIVSLHAKVQVQRTTRVDS